MSNGHSFSKYWHEKYYDRRSQNKQNRRSEALQILENLEKLWDDTDPSKGHDSGKNKDLAAQEAFLFVGQFSDLMAGWTLDHAIGKAISEYELILAKNKMILKTSKPIGQPAKTDLHGYECKGRTLSWEFGPPIEYNSECMETTRKILLTVLQNKSTILPKDMALLVCEALRAVNFGSKPELFEGMNVKWAKKNYMQLNSQLKAVEHVEYRVTDGSKKSDAIDKVAGAYGMNVKTIENWIDNISDDLGKEFVESRLQLARDASYAFKNAYSTKAVVTAFEAEKEYGDLALKNDGRTLYRLGMHKKTVNQRTRIRSTKP